MLPDYGDFLAPSSARRPLWPLAAAVAVTAAIILVLAFALRAHAMPPADADLALGGWFQSLAQPGTGYPCCSIADCRTVKYRSAGDHFEAFIDRNTFGDDAPDNWLPVPPEHVLRRKDNPTGEAVVCWYNGEIRCFVEGAGI